MGWFTKVTLGIQVATVLLRWFEDANKDGKITGEEALNLVTSLAEMFGFKTAINLPSGVGEVAASIRKVVR